VKLALSHIDAKSILLMCDDYFVSNPIDNENLESLYSSFSEFNVGNLRLSPNPLPLNIYTKDSNFGKYDIKQPYRVSTQVGFWKKSFLLDLLKTEMPIHNFERMGSPASAEINEVILCTMKRSFPFIDAIHKGKWEQSAIQLCDLNHIDFNDSLRPMMSDYDYFRKYLKSIIYNKFPKIVTKIMALLTQYRSKKNV
jgi:hypothetical protein